MTELGHGSDVAGPGDHDHLRRRDRRVRRPLRTEDATKAYIGNAADHGTMAVVFGQLLVADGTTASTRSWCRSAARTDATCPASPPATTGAKGGLLGVDNGTISFDHVRVPRAMLLDRYGGVDDTGTYHSPIESAPGSPLLHDARHPGARPDLRQCRGGDRRPAGLSIATRYALQRRQFAVPGTAEPVLLADYLPHQRRLLPLIAKAYALGFAQNDSARRWSDPSAGRRHTEAEKRSSRPGPPASRPSRPGSPTTPCRRAARPAAVRAIMAENRLTRSARRRRRVRHVRGRQHRPAAAGGQGAAGRLPRSVGRARSAGPGAGVCSVFGDSVIERTARPACWSSGCPSQPAARP